MRAKQLIEKLEDLATFLTLSASDAGNDKKKEADKGIIGDSLLVTFYQGKKEAYETAFNKVDKIIKEAKR